jgi:hypothetical protein
MIHDRRASRRKRQKRGLTWPRDIGHSNLRVDASSCLRLRDGPAPLTGEMEMTTLPMNDDFANRELSIEELEAIAAGHWWNTALHAVEHAAGAVGSWVYHHPVESAIIGVGTGLGIGIVASGSFTIGIGILGAVQ